MTVLGLDTDTVTGDDLRAAADAAYSELDDRDVEMDGVGSGAAYLAGATEGD